MSVTEADVRRAVLSFLSSSTGGPDGSTKRERRERIGGEEGTEKKNGDHPPTIFGFKVALGSAV